MKLKTVIGSAIAAVGVAACGSSPVTPTVQPVTAAPTVAATVAPTPTLVPTPSPTATPAPKPTLAVLSQGQELMVVNSQGVEQWELSNAAMEKIFGLSASQEKTQGFGINSQIVGSNIYLFYENPQGITEVAEISRAGKAIARGTAPSNGVRYISSAVVFSPSGTQWAWSVDQTPNANGKHDGLIEVGGLGEANRIVYRWVSPVDFTEEVIGWSNTGIIMQREEYWGGCSSLGIYDPLAAWFALNPSTGKLTELFTGNDQFMGASSGVTVAGLINDPHAVLINGVKYSESKSTIDGGASISPDGAHVAVTRVISSGPTGYCGLVNNKYSLEMVTVANHTHVDLPMGIDSWWGDSQFIAPGSNGSTWLYTLAGKPVSEICPANPDWGYAGELS